MFLTCAFGRKLLDHLQKLRSELIQRLTLILYLFSRDFKFVELVHKEGLFRQKNCVLRFLVTVAYLETFGRWVPPLHLKKISHGHPTTGRSMYVISVSLIFICIRSLLVYNVELL